MEVEWPREKAQDAMTAVRFQLAQVRKQRKLSREALAQIAGIRVATLRSLEDGTARVLNWLPWRGFVKYSIASRATCSRCLWTITGFPFSADLMRTRSFEPGAMLRARSWAVLR